VTPPSPSARLDTAHNHRVRKLANGNQVLSPTAADSALSAWSRNLSPLQNLLFNDIHHSSYYFLGRSEFVNFSSVIFVRSSLISK